MGGSWDQIWSTEVPVRTLYGQNLPFLPLFDRFLKLGGSIWTITVLDEQSIPLRFSGHPTSLYFEKKIPTQNWPVEFKGQRTFRAKWGPFRAPGGPGEARYQVKVCGDHVSSQGGPIGGSWDQIWFLGALRGPPRSPKGPFMAKMGPFCLFLIVFSNWVVLYGL